MKNVAEVLVNVNLALIDMWFNSKGLKHLALGLALWFYGLVMFPVHFVLGIWYWWIRG
jgi:hypothetical protein